MNIENLVLLLQSFRQVQPVKLSELLILGLLSHRNLSGYDIHQYVESRIVHRSNAFLRIEKATLYNTLQRLEKQEFIQITEKIVDEKRPTRYVYTLTPHGRNYLKKLILRNSNNPPFIFVNTYLNFPFYNILTKNEIKKTLNGKITQLQSMIELLQLYVQVESGSIIAIILESEIAIYKNILQTSKMLLKQIVKRPLEEIFRIEKLFEEEIRAEILSILKDSQIGGKNSWEEPAGGN
jgi:DNA-binding PadR family transcriptional regulator